MTKAFDKIKAGLDDAIAYAGGDASRGRVVAGGTTPKPWVAKQDGNAANYNIANLIEGPNGELIAYGQLTDDDADLIVRAVNSYDMMKSALEDVLVYVDHEYPSISAQIRTALKAASDE